MVLDSFSEFFQLLRFSLGIAEEFPTGLTEQQWARLYQLSLKHAIIGVTYTGIERMPAGQRPPIEVTAQWYIDADNIKRMNANLNEEARKVTEMFVEEGRRTAILKGQANARLYPHPESRHPGDIDIWVEGGEEKVLELLRQKGLMDDSTRVFYHHIQFYVGEHVEVEVHFRPTSCKSQQVQDFLNRELEQVTLCPEGFYIPSTPFALVMQLAHIRTHLFSKGVGLRQLIDYYFLLRSCTPEERRRVGENLKSLGMYHAAAALMWLLGEIFLLDEQYMLVRPNARSGRWMLAEVLEKGNFGLCKQVKKATSWQHFRMKKRRVWEHILFEPQRTMEFLRKEGKYWVNLFVTIPRRIKYRTLSLKEVS